MKTNIKLFFASLAMILGQNFIFQAQTVTIGTQVWTTKNLDVSTFRNGDVIPQASTDEAWEAAGENKQPAWCYYDNDPKNGTKYGKLYNWYAVNDPRGLAPAGYHIPTDAEWTVLTDYLGGESLSGEKMKSISGWDSYSTGGSKTCPNCKNWTPKHKKKAFCDTCKDTRRVSVLTIVHSGNGTNSSGFSGLPSGVRTNSGSFRDIGKSAVWWSSTEHAMNSAWPRSLYYFYGSTRRNFVYKEVGLPVRCVKD
jgi:uncharacterized protein (TIGR02145 family)